MLPTITMLPETTALAAPPPPAPPPTKPQGPQRNSPPPPPAPFPISRPRAAPLLLEPVGHVADDHDAAGDPRACGRHRAGRDQQLGAALALAMPERAQLHRL